MAHILVNDILYGNFIVEPVLEALINSKAVQRLKNVHMAGPAYLTNSLWNETRYEHSIGVMLLVRKLGGSIEEQAAALLHDVSHTVDDALSNKDENCHEIIKREIVEDSDLLNILNVYYLNPEIVLFDDSNFYLLKKSIPSLCAYRLDYTLKEVHRYFNIEITEIHAFLESLRVFKKEICIQSIEKAEWFVDMYNKIVLDFFYDPLNVTANRLMADIISYALKRHLISEHNLKLDDYQFLKRLSDLNDDFIMEQLNRLNASFEYKVVTKDEDYTIQLQTKARIIDPTVYTNHKKVLASTLSKYIYKKKHEAHEMSNSGICLSLLE